MARTRGTRRSENSGADERPVSVTGRSVDETGDDLAEQARDGVALRDRAVA
jgi:hypothetical protein